MLIFVVFIFIFAFDFLILIIPFCGIQFFFIATIVDVDCCVILLYFVVVIRGLLGLFFQIFRITIIIEISVFLFIREI